MCDDRATREQTGAPATRGIVVRVSPDRVLRVLLACIAVLIAVSLIAVAFRLGFDLKRTRGLVRLLDVNQEANLPTWFSTIMLLGSAVLLYLIGRTMAIAGETWHRHWLGLAAIFVVLSLDEAAMLHEGTARMMRPFVTADGIFQHLWVIPGTIAVAVFAAIYARFVIALPPATRRAFVLAGTIFVFGALIVEFVEGAYVSKYGYGGLEIGLLTAFQEACEMVGIAIFIRGLLQHMERSWNGLDIHLRTNGDGA